MSINSTQGAYYTCPSMQEDVFQEKAKELSNKTVHIESADIKLRKRMAEFRSLDKRETVCKTAAVACLLIPVIGWILIPILWNKASQAQQLKQDLIKEFSEQLGKDTSRRFVLTINGTQFTNPKLFISALNKTKLSDVDKYTILQLAHQGLFATLLGTNYLQMLQWGNTHCPLVQEDGKPLRRIRAGDNEDDRRPYMNVKDITEGQGKTISLAIQGEKCTVSSRLQQGIVVLDRIAKAPYQGRTVFEFDTHFTIDVGSGKMQINSRLDRINPLDEPVRLYGLEVSDIDETERTQLESGRRDSVGSSPSSDSSSCDIELALK